MMTQKILLIKNDPDVRNIISYILHAEGFGVIPMGMPQHLDEIAVQDADLILIDEWLSGQPGHRLCLQIKRLERLMHVPVIIVSTANYIEEIMTECRANAFIRKPFDLEELVEKVKGLLAEQDQLEH